MQIICLAIIPGQMEAGDFRNPVSGPGMKGRTFVLRRDRYLSKHLARSGKVDTALRGVCLDGRQKVVSAAKVSLKRRELIFKGVTDITLRGQVVAVVRFEAGDQLQDAGVILQGCTVEVYLP